MKRLKLIALLTFILIFTGFTNVNASSIKIKYGKNYETKYDITPEDYEKTIYDFKKTIASDINIDADYQVFITDDGYVENDKAKLEYYFLYNYPEYERVYQVYERKDFLSDEIVLKSVEPTEDNVYDIFYEAVERTYYGYAIDPETCTNNYTNCTLKNASNGEEIRKVNVKYDYNSKEKEKIDNLVKNVVSKINDEILLFSLKDLELINYWVNKGAIINYSDEYKSLINFKNVYLDIKGGDDYPLISSGIGTAYYKIDNTIYYVIPNMGVESYNILYVPNDTDDNHLLDTLQKRIDSYIGKDKVKLEKTEFTTDENPILGDSDLKVKEESYDKIIYKATINNEKIYFVIGKNTSKMYTPKLTTSDIDTDIIITTKEGTIPLDTMIRVKEITDGKAYESIMKLINSSTVDMYDLSLFAKSIDKYINKIDDNTFEVKIPLKEEFKDKDLVVYYVNDKSEVKEYEVTVKDGFAIFTTDHFSIYTLAIKNDNVKGNEKSDLPEEKSEVKEEQNEDTKITNPTTSDNIMIHFSIVIVGLLSVGIYLKGKMKTYKVQ